MGKYNILIVEDEPLVRKGISSIIASLSDKVASIEEASTGTEAIEVAEKLLPDIVIMDIKLPEMDGLKAATLIRRKFPKVRIVILTAYPEFEYAKEAIKLNAVDYILKPIDEKSLKSLINRLVVDIDEEREKELNIELIKSKLGQILPYAKMRLAYDLILNSIEDEEQIKQILQAIGIYFLPSTVIIVSIGNFTNLSSREVYSNLLLKEEIYSILQERLEKNYKAFVIPFRFNEFVIFYSPEEADKEEIKSITLNLGEYICKEINNKIPSVLVYVGIGRTYRDISYIHKSYLEAVAAISQRNVKGNKVIYIDDIGEIENWQILCPSREKELQEYIIKREKKQAIDTIQKLLIEIYENFRDNLTMVKSSILYIMVDNFRLIAKLGGDIEKLITLQARYINGLIEINSFSDILTWTSLVVEELISTYSETNTKKEIVEKAIRFINENYTNDISLKEVADYLFISPYYLSHIFKDVTRKTFIEYLTSIKLDRAKELLTTTNLSVSNISLMLNYKDVNYFSKVFKKHTGVTPSQYRTSYIKGGIKNR